MKNLVAILLIVVLNSCKSNDVIITPDFIDGVPDARFAGTWYNSNSRQIKYEFSEVDNKGNYFIASINGGPAIAYTFYWRKSSTKGKFEIKKDFGDKAWTDFGLEFIDEKSIRIESENFTK